MAAASAFQEELVKCPTFHNFADPILHNIVVKDIFACVYLVSTEQITNRVSLEITGIGYNSSELDRDRYSGNCLFKVAAGNVEEEEEKESYMPQKIEVSDIGIPDLKKSKRFT